MVVPDPSSKPHAPTSPVDAEFDTVTVIEVALIVSVMLSAGPEKAGLARDTDRPWHLLSGVVRAARPHPRLPQRDAPVGRGDPLQLEPIPPGAQQRRG